ncbi:glycine zipper 2TM domain-containing protein [Cognatiluteimonas weifangensis]|uniref:Glycine zipper 2TM domain-containing protein n=1 Tax=Cognatiluteimonas weifangensis TaxID=2303539 RepID=A0A372DNH3_9GAMM|nr:glycine zipper 2TM domain-containing protein [Luteimonas weifangensis]RFP61076.1 glycine zipper 2TM domain-containing protein [Luteimonas weifangensis]
MKNNTLAIALAALLVGGVAVAAFQNNRASAPEAAADAGLAAGDVAAADGSIPASGRLEYAQVIKVDPVTEKQELYAQVIGTEPVRETSTTSTPREVCNDVVVQERLPERDGNVGGTVAGAVIGGLIGNQVGGGDGRKLATVAGAVGGGFAGREIDRRHVGGQIVNRTERQCRTTTSTSQSTRTVAWNVTYRNPDGTTGSLRTDRKPGNRIALGSQEQVIAYDVTYRYDGQERTIRMDDKPGERLPVIDGQLVTQVAAVEDGTTRQ